MEIRDIPVAKICPPFPPPNKRKRLEINYCRKIKGRLEEVKCGTREDLKTLSSKIEAAVRSITLDWISLLSGIFLVAIEGGAFWEAQQIETHLGSFAGSMRF